MENLEHSMKQRALAEGFDLVGIAAAGPTRTGSTLERWLRAGMHGTMEFMSSTGEVRLDPAHVLPGCRSIIAVAMSYHCSEPASTEAAEAGTVWVSRYAWGRDYHKVMKKKLIRVGRWLDERVGGCSWRACVDTVPILEREWAYRAGLGWIGKNTMLLDRKFGSELFLGLLLTDLALDADQEKPEHCGKCTACIDICPTQAITQPRQLDASRCIAYLTIEHKGPIEKEFQAPMSDMVAGCDLCQEVCPWTKRAPSDIHPEFAPAPRRYRPRLGDLELFSEREYLDWRAGSPLNRIPFEGFTRNLEVARNNLGRIVEDE